MGLKDYSPEAGKDALSWDEAAGFKGSMPQRGTRPSLDLSPENDDFYTGGKFNLGRDSSACADDYNDLGFNPLNQPVDERTKPLAVNGWQTIASDISSTSDGFHGKSGGGTGGEKR